MNLGGLLDDRIDVARSDQEEVIAQLQLCFEFKADPNAIRKNLENSLPPLPAPSAMLETMETDALLI